MNDDGPARISTVIEATEPGLTEVLHALSDPVRRAIVHGLAHEGARACGTFGHLGVSNSTLSHHLPRCRTTSASCARLAWIETHDEGRQRVSTLRRDELERRLPGLLALVDGEDRTRPRQ